MKGKRQKRRNSARMRRMRRRRVKSTVLLLLLLAALAGAGCGALYLLRGGMFTSPVQPYSTAREFENQLITGAEQRSQTFAENLCVMSAEDILLDTVSLDEGESGLLLDLDKKEALYAKGAFDRVYPASITKIMTGMLALRYGNMDDLVTITAENLNLEEGSQVCGFVEGDQVTLSQLLHCLLVYSGNDAAAAIAEHIAGSEAAFVDMMNSYAAELGCTGTHFTNPHGLQDEDHYTTPYDIYLMLKEALNYPDFTSMTQMSSYTLEVNRDGVLIATNLQATDHYLTGEATPPKNVTVLGGKTGTTSMAGNCLALLSQDAFGKPYVSIIMGAGTKELLYVQMNSLLSNLNGS